MRYSRDFMVQRSRASDGRYDGRFYVGVKSTGIYCLVSCRARPPREENMVFVATVEEARALGLRPCLRCHPDAFVAGRDDGHEQVVALLARLRRDVAAVPDVAALAALAGWGQTRLHELIRQHLQLSPAGLLERERVAAAGRLLLRGREPVADVAFAVGYRSLSAFHRQLRRQTGLAPGELRRLGERCELVLALPTDLRVDDTLRVLGRDPESGSERRSGLTFSRALSLDGTAATVTVQLSPASARDASGIARCVVQADRAPSPAAMAQAHRAVLAWLGFPADPRPFERQVGGSGNGTVPRNGRRGAPGCRGERRGVDVGDAQARLADGVARLVGGRPGLRVPRMTDGWDALVWAVLGQQVNLALAMRMRRRLVERFGTVAPGGLIAPPGPAVVAAAEPAELVALGLSRRKAEVLVDLARAVASGDLPLADFADGTATAAEQALVAQRGVGPWTAAYVAMRGFGFLDALPVGDSGLATALARLAGRTERPDASEQRRLAAPFAPYRSLLTMHLWLSLGDSP